MLPFDGIDEIAAYRNDDGSFQVELAICGKDIEGRQTTTTIKIPHAQLDLSMSVGYDAPINYRIVLEG